MPPSRTRDNHQNGEASTSKTKPKPTKRHRRPPSEKSDSNAVPGVQKVKAALRQTRRLLAKDNLAADVRVETERRLKALEAELHQAEIARKERAFAIRYHKVKFFERQKVTRKLSRAKKALAATEDLAEKKKLSSDLQDLRVDLNYILHYPKTKKYISLFPPEVRKGEKISVSSQADTEKTNKDREELREWIREQMEKGNLPAEPELELNATPVKPRAQNYSQKRITAPPTAGEKTQTADVEEDEFFGEDDEEDGDEESS